MPQHLLPLWLLCVKSLAMALLCFFLEQASEGIFFSAAELMKVSGGQKEKVRRDREDLGELSSE